MLKSLMIITGNYPPDSGGPAKFSENFSIWCEFKEIKTRIVTYADTTELKLVSKKRSVHSINRFLPLPIKFLRMMIGIIKENRESQEILAVGSFLETYFASIITNFEYVAKVPGDIVWERARNNKVTDLNIIEFQSVRLSWKYRLFRVFFTRSLLKARRVIVPSQGLFDLCLKWGVPKHNLVLIYNSVNDDFYNIKHILLKEFDLITVCRLTPWKGVKELITFSAEHNKKLAIVGDGPLRTELENYAKLTNAKVVFYGDVSQKKICDIMSKSKIFVLNSSYEGLPHALIEARAAGLLSVACANTGSAEVIHDGIDGYLINEDRDLNQTLQTALNNYAINSDMQLKAKQDVHNRFDKQRNFCKILKLLENNLI